MNMLMMNKIDGSNVLILDEPEVSLHPMWQNAFAEIIVLHAKEMNVNILLTTHSWNLLPDLQDCFCDNIALSKYSSRAFHEETWLLCCIHLSIPQA